MHVIEAVRWSPSGDGVRIIDQTLLPEKYEERDLRTLDEVCEAIACLAVRGAPAIGIAGAMGLVVSLAPHTALPVEAFLKRAREHAARIRATRPTAVNLPWAIERMLARAFGHGGPPPFQKYDTATPIQPSSHRMPGQILSDLRAEASAILAEDRAMCRRIGEHGLALVPDGSRILTHCNAGALATGGIGTALAPIYLAVEAGMRVEVYAGETRPLFQGSRLTAWELARAGIAVTVLADSMAASLMRSGRIDMVMVGADRIAANGDVANKIGTYALAVVARHHRIPFYVAAPASTFDSSIPNGNAIEIEQRAPSEISLGCGRTTVPEGAAVVNPAFDITPAELITAIISDRGVHLPPYDFSALASGPWGAAVSGRAVPTPHPPTPTARLS